MILGDLVALTGVEPGFAGPFCFLQVAETTKAGFDMSQESQAVCTKHVHESGLRLILDDDVSLQGELQDLVEVRGSVLARPTSFWDLKREIVPHA